MKRSLFLSIFYTFVLGLVMFGSNLTLHAQENDAKNRQVRTKKALENMLWVAGIQTKQNEKNSSAIENKKIALDFPEELTRPLAKLSLKL